MNGLQLGHQRDMLNACFQFLVDDMSPAMTVTSAPRSSAICQRLFVVGRDSLRHSCLHAIARTRQIYPQSVEPDGHSWRQCEVLGNEVLGKLSSTARSTELPAHLGQIKTTRRPLTHLAPTPRPDSTGSQAGPATVWLCWDS